MKNLYSHKFNKFILLSLLTTLIVIVQTNIPVLAQTPRQLEREKPVNNQKRIALVIGNSAYESSPLRNPVNDATDIAAALRSLGFEVILQTNLTQIAMKEVIDSFGESLRTKGGVGLFYYAGHGVQVKGKNYLIPVGAKVETEQMVEYESVDVGRVLSQMESARNPMNFVILDACRNNPFARSFRSDTKGLASIDAPSGTLIAYSTAPGSVASDGAGRNGLYTQEFLKQLKTSGLSVEDIFKRVRVAVRQATEDKQTPWESSSLTGDFYFLGTKSANQVNMPVTNPQTIVPETANTNRMPSSEEILTKYSKAIGYEKFSSIQTLVKKGTVEAEGNGKKFNGLIEDYSKKPDNSLSLTVVGTFSSMQGFSGNKGWSYEQGIGAKDLLPQEIESFNRSAAIGSGDVSLIKQFYPQIIFKGIEKLGNSDVYVLEAKRIDGKTEIFYIDTVSNFLSRWDFETPGLNVQQGINVLTQLYFEDYIDLNGFHLPTTIRQKNANLTITFRWDISQMKYNVPISDSLFKKP